MDTKTKRQMMDLQLFLQFLKLGIGFDSSPEIPSFGPTAPPDGKSIDVFHMIFKEFIFTSCYPELYRIDSLSGETIGSHHLKSFFSLLTSEKKERNIQIQSPWIRISHQID